MSSREQTLTHWLQQILPPLPFTIAPLAGDASFRRYFRLTQGAHSFVIMDAPPEKEPLTAFLHVHQLLKNAGIHVPHCFHQNLDHGFLMLADFGDRLLLHQLRQDYTHTPYYAALEVLLQLQTIHDPRLPCFNHAHILQELSLFSEWFLQRYLQLSLTPAERQLLQDTQLYLAQALTQQPQVFIHRDYHSRNLMPLSDQRLGVIDFQDAMIGPIGYDIVSLLKDCYIQWPLEDCLAYWQYYHQRAPQVSHLPFDTFSRYVEDCGLQRHLKVLGIFSRLALRDGKPHYLNDLPLTLHYVMQVLACRPELHTFYHFMQQRVSLP